jgi:hypothetical protein
MTITGRLIVLGAVIGAGLVVGRVIGRVRRSSCFSEVGDQVAIFDVAGHMVRCEDGQGRPVALGLCQGAEPCRAGAAADDEPDR